MDKYKCTCCGGNINRATMMCEYCGTLYKEEMGVLRIETYTNPVRTLAAKCIIPRREIYFFGEGESANMAMRSIRDQIAEALTEVMSYDVEFDTTGGVYIVRGQVKAVTPADHGEGRVFNTFKEAKK